MPSESAGYITAGDVLRHMSKAIYPTNDPELIFVEWMISNMGDLQVAVTELGLVVEEGPNFAKRLKEVVLPKLLEMHRQ